MADQPIELDPAVDDELELHDHPDAISDQEAMSGFLMWKAVDDLDDYSNGLRS